MIISILEGYTGVESGGSGRGAGSKRTATRVYTVVTDNPADSPVWAFPVTDDIVTIPAAGDPHPDYWAMKSGKPHVVKKGPTYFQVRVPYETNDPSNSQQNHEDPLSAPADISWDDSERTVAYDRDMDNNPVVNTMGEPFDPPLTRSVSDPVLIIERNQAAFYPDDKLSFQDSVCSHQFWGADLGRARMGKIKARTCYGETFYWRVRYEIIFRMHTPAGVTPADAWHRQILNQGVNYKDADGKTHPSPNGELVLLAADGTKTDESSPHWLKFREFPALNWMPLGLE